MKKTRLIAILMTICLTTLMLTSCGGSADKEEAVEKSARTADNYNTIEEGGLRFQMPDYFGEPELSGSVKNYYAETGNGLVDLQLYSIDGTLNEDSFEDECREIYDSTMSGLKNTDGLTDFLEGSSNEMTLECGLHSMMYIYSFTLSGVDITAIMTFINNIDSGKIIVASLMQSDQSEYDYTNAYTKMIRKCEMTDDGSASEDTSEQNGDSSDSDSGLLSPEFKKTMDDYEAWFDHYCEVMKKYQEDPSNLELLSEMTELLSEETTMLEEMEKMDQSDMNTAELAYYLEVTARIEKNLLEVANY